MIPSRWLRYVLEVASRPGPLQARAEKLVQDHQAALGRRRARTLPRRREARAARQGESAATRAVYKACSTRARGRSEHSGDRGKLEMDHYFGRDQETAETCWMLTSEEHLDKTDNRPSRLEWHRRFRQHCLRYGYGRALALLEPLIALELGQHPASSEASGG